MLEPSTGQLVLAWSIIIVMYIGFSALAGFILWACARRIGKVSKATFMNSWGLFWILHISQIAFNLVFWFLWTLIATQMYQSFIASVMGDEYSSYYTPFMIGSSWSALYPGEIFLLIFLIVLYVILSIYFAVLITKAFWDCSFKNSAFTHVLPIAIFLGLFIIYIMSAFHFGWTLELVAPEVLYQ